MENVYYMVNIIIASFNLTLLTTHFKKDKAHALQSLNHLSKDTKPMKSRPGIWAQLCMTLSTG